MSDKKTEQSEIVEGIHKTEVFFSKNRNILIYAVGGILLVITVFFGYKEFISKPKNIEASEQLYFAQNHFERDSFRLALIGNGPLEPGFEYIADEYSSTPSGNLANFYAGVCCLRLGEYHDAIEYFKKFKSKDEIFAPRALANIGNCYVELIDYENAIKYFEKAAYLKDNDMSATYLMKACLVYEKLEQYSKALKLYEEIKYKYPATNEARNIDKYIERIKASN